MGAIRMQTLERIMDEFRCHESLRAGLQELIEPRMGVISGFQEIIDSAAELKSQDLGEITPF